MSDMRIDLPELGANQFVVMRDPNVLPWRVQRQLASYADKDDLDSKMQSAETLAVALLKDGNVLDWDGKRIPFPVTTETVGDLPAEVLVAVINKFGEMRGASVEKKS